MPRDTRKVAKTKVSKPKKKQATLKQEGSKRAKKKKATKKAAPAIGKAELELMPTPNEVAYQINKFRLDDPKIEHLYLPVRGRWFEHGSGKATGLRIIEKVSSSEAFARGWVYSERWSSDTPKEGTFTFEFPPNDERFLREFKRAQESGLVMWVAFVRGSMRIQAIETQRLWKEEWGSTTRVRVL